MTELKCKYSGEMCPYVPVALSIRCDECMVKKAYKRGFYEQRPHGEWKPDGTCSECGVYSSLNKDTAYFCPNCGADMRGEE